MRSFYEIEYENIKIVHIHLTDFKLCSTFYFEVTDFSSPLAGTLFGPEGPVAELSDQTHSDGFAATECGTRIGNRGHGYRDRARRVSPYKDKSSSTQMCASHQYFFLISPLHSNQNARTRIYHRI